MSIQSYMTIIQVQTARPEDFGGKIQLLAPVGDDIAAKKALGPGVHLLGNGLGNLQELRVSGDGQFETALVIKGQGACLSQGIFTVKHPAVSSGQQGVGDIAQTRFDRNSGFGRRTGSLQPLTLKIVRDHCADEIAVTGILNADARAFNHGLWIQKADFPSFFHAHQPPPGALVHQAFLLGIKLRHKDQGCQCFWRVDVSIVLFKMITDL